MKSKYLGLSFITAFIILLGVGEYVHVIANKSVTNQYSVIIEKIEIVSTVSDPEKLSLEEFIGFKITLKTEIKCENSKTKILFFSGYKTRGSALLFLAAGNPNCKYLLRFYESGIKKINGRFCIGDHPFSIELIK